VGHTSISDGLLRLEASRAGVFQSDLKIDEDAIMSGARDFIRLRREEAEDR
jgi:hypothetical protein